MAYPDCWRATKGNMMDKDEAYLINDSQLKIENGRYVVFDDDGNKVAQDDDPNAALDTARKKGAKAPALVDLELQQDRTYVF